MIYPTTAESYRVHSLTNLHCINWHYSTPSSSSVQVFLEGTERKRQPHEVENWTLGFSGLSVYSPSSCLSYLIGASYVVSQTIILFLLLFTRQTGSLPDYCNHFTHTSHQGSSSTTVLSPANTANKMSDKTRPKSSPVLAAQSSQLGRSIDLS